MKPLPLLSALLFLQTGCAIGVKTVRMDLDPREEKREKWRESDEQANVEAFITAHPDLTPAMKRDLRSGVLSRHAALEQLKKK